ncbi:MAG: aminopeptidase [Chloroflexota bacterium]|nr:aminopeptidase [Chloroflexota bacterium]
MSDPRLNNLARTLVNYSIDVKPDDWVYISSGVVALPLAREVLRFVLRAGGRANVIFDSDDLSVVTLKESSTAQLEWVSPVEELLFDQMDALISLRGPSNTRALSGVDPQKQQTRQIARRHLTETYLKRAAEGSLRWVITNYPCAAFAQEADMSLEEYQDFVYSATFSDLDDPIKAWQKVHDEQQRLVDWLVGKKQVVVHGPNSDLTLSIEGRKFINSDGKKNMPSGEIFTGPVEDSANGWVRFTYPAITGGREVEGVELEFNDGKVVSAKAKKNEQYLITMLDSDQGARFLGEFAIGTNYGIKKFTKSILFDEKIGGSFHMAVGAGYPETGSKNKSSIHWDFICDMRDNSEILVDGELFYKNGEFQI